MIHIVIEGATWQECKQKAVEVFQDLQAQTSGPTINVSLAAGPKMSELPEKLAPEAGTEIAAPEEAAPKKKSKKKEEAVAKEAPAPAPEVSEDDPCGLFDDEPTKPTPVTEPVKKVYKPEEVSAALKKVNDTAGIKTVIQLAKNFNAKKVAEIKPEYYPQVMAGCDHILALAATTKDQNILVKAAADFKVTL